MITFVQVFIYKASAYQNIRKNSSTFSYCVSVIVIKTFFLTFNDIWGMIPSSPLIDENILKTKESIQWTPGIKSARDSVIETYSREGNKREACGNKRGGISGEFF